MGARFIMGGGGSHGSNAPMISYFCYSVLHKNMIMLFFTIENIIPSILVSPAGLLFPPNDVSEVSHLH